MNALSRYSLPLLFFAAACGGPDDANLEALDDGQDDALQITAACPHKALLKYGLHPDASDRLRCIGIDAGDISQTIGDAPASAGYHAKDGTAGGQPYTAAVDLRTASLGESQIRTLLGKLAGQGFAAWYRKPGSDGWPSSEAPHIHAVYAGCAMKGQLDEQVADFKKGLSGLASHSRYTFYLPSQSVRDSVYDLWNKHN
jgi:hypothetical protein